MKQIGCTTYTSTKHKPNYLTWATKRAQMAGLLLGRYNNKGPHARGRLPLSRLIRATLATQGRFAQGTEPPTGK